MKTEAISFLIGAHILAGDKNGEKADKIIGKDTFS